MPCVSARRVPTLVDVSGCRSVQFVGVTSCQSTLLRSWTFDISLYICLISATIYSHSNSSSGFPRLTHYSVKPWQLSFEMLKQVTSTLFSGLQMFRLSTSANEIIIWRPIVGKIWFVLQCLGYECSICNTFGSRWTTIKSRVRVWMRVFFLNLPNEMRTLTLRIAEYWTKQKSSFGLFRFDEVESVRHFSKGKLGKNSWRQLIEGNYRFEQNLIQSPVVIQCDRFSPINRTVVCRVMLCVD